MSNNTYLWAAAHNILPEQRAELEQGGGEVMLMSELAGMTHKKLCNITPDTDMVGLARELISLCNRHEAVLVQPAGSPAFQYVLGRTNEQALRYSALIPICYAVSERVSEDIPQPDGSVKKVSVFKHLGFQYV